MSIESDPYCSHCGAQLEPHSTKCPACGSLTLRATSDPNILPPGFTLNKRYQIIALVGKGGSGKVYKAHDSNVNRDVAVKETNLREESEEDAEKKLDSFNLEAHLLVNLNHPNCPTIHDSFALGGNVYLVMEFIDGKNLEESLPPNQPYGFMRTVELGLTLCKILKYVHSKYIKFRDLKPSNIMIRASDQRVFLIDFGIARLFDPRQDKKDTGSLGTYGYAAPEQHDSQTRTESDIYSLGVLLYQLMTGKDPTEGQTPFTPDLQLDDFPQRQPDDEHIYTAIVQLVNEMRKVEYTKRPSIKEVEKRLKKIQALLRSHLPSLPPEEQLVDDPPPPKWPQGHLLHTYKRHRGTINALAWAPTYNSTLLASASDDRTVQVWQVSQEKPITVYRGHGRGVNALAWSPDGKYIASVGQDRLLHIWDTATGRNLLRWEGHKDWIRTVAWSPNGKYIATGSDDNYVYIWDAQSGHRLRELLHDDGVLAVTWSPDSTRIAAGGHDCVISIWTIATEMLPVQIKDHRYAVSALAWSPDGNLIISGSWDKTVRSWDSVALRQVEASYRGHKGLVTAVACFTWASSLYIASTSIDKTIHIREPFTNAPPFIYTQRNTALRALACSPSGSSIASAGEEQIVHIWQAV